MLGLESAPLASYLTLDDQRLHHMASHTVGLMVGTDTVRAGPIGTAGFWVLGAGARVVITPFKNKSRYVHEGFEARGLWLYNGAPAGEVTAMYTFSLDPRRRTP
jgi:hypothetical protein